MSKIAVGVIGLGLGRHHVASYAESSDVARLVVCDADGAQVAAIRQEFPKIAAGYTSLSTLLDSEQLDAVSIVTPDHLHRPHAEQCLAAGCHVLLTKPLATNLDDGRAIVSAAQAAGKHLMVAHERRFRSRIRAVKRLLQEGSLGDIVHLRIDAIQDKRRQFERSPWYASAEAGRSALVGSGIHEVDLLRYLIDTPIVSVSAYSNRLGTLEFPKDKTTAAIYQFEGGTIGQVTVTYEAHWPGRGKQIDDHFRLIGSQGIIVGNQVAKDGQADWESLPEDASEIVTGSHGCVTAFLDTLLHDAAIAVTGQDAFDSLAAAAAADESAANGGKPCQPVGL